MSAKAAATAGSDLLSRLIPVNPIIKTQVNVTEALIRPEIHLSLQYATASAASVASAASDYSGHYLAYYNIKGDNGVVICAQPTLIRNFSPHQIDRYSNLIQLNFFALPIKSSRKKQQKADKRGNNRPEWKWNNRSGLITPVMVVNAP